MSQEIEFFFIKETSLLKKEITCTICLDIFIEPITLTTCQHTFCMDCFKNLFSNQKKSFECPLCKKLTNRRSYYANKQFVATDALLKMYDKLMVPIGLEKIDETYRKNRMTKYLDDCINFLGCSGTPECVSLSSSDESDSKLEDLNPKLKEYTIRSHASLPILPKTTIQKTKPLKCTKVKGKFPQKQKTKSGENTNIGNSFNIDEYDSPDVFVLGKEKTKIVKLLEEDFLKNIENEAQNINKIEKDNELQATKDKTNNQKKQRKHESNLNSISKSAGSKSTKKPGKSTGWSRMKTMKKQIKKKEVKYKQLNVSTEINKNKSKSPEDKNTKIDKKSKAEVINLDRERESKSESSQDKNTNNEICKKSEIVNLDDENEMNEIKNTSIQEKIDNITKDKLDLLLQCVDKNVNENDNLDDVFSMCTQKLQNPNQFIANEIERCSPENKTLTSAFLIDTENDINEFIINAQVHNSSTPVKISEKQILEEVASNTNKINKNVTSNEKKSSAETDDIISVSERTPELVIRKSLRNSAKRKFDEHPEIQNKVSQKIRKLGKSKIKCKSVDIAINERGIPNLKNENNATVIEETSSQNKKISELSTKENSTIVKNELKFVSDQESKMISALQSSIKSITVVLSQCSNYTNSESLFSDSWPPKEIKCSKSNPETYEQSKVLTNNFYSLPVQSNSRSPISFYGTAIPCLQKIHDFYEQVISLSQQVTTDTENFISTFNENNEAENVIVSLKSLKNAEVQTENVKCPKCSNMIDFKSFEKGTATEKTFLNGGFKELNDLDNISKHFSNENESQISKDNSDKAKVNYPSNVNSNKNSEITSGSDIVCTKQVNRQLTYSDHSNNSQRRKFKRIRSPTPDSDSESVKSKKSNTNYCKLLYRDDIDIFFQSEPSEKLNELSLSGQTGHKCLKKLSKNYEKQIALIEKDPTVNPEDSTSKYISILEREYKDAQFNKISKSGQPVEKQNFDTAPNTVLDKLLGSINLSVFDNDNFGLEKNIHKIAPLLIETEEKNTSSEKKADNTIPDVLSTSIFNTEKDVNKISDVDKTKSIEKLQLKVDLTPQNAMEKELDKEVESLTSHITVVDDSFGSDTDMFGDDIFVESTPQKPIENKRERSKFVNTKLPATAFDILEPPPSVTENLDWIDIAPPPPLEFQDTEQVEKSILNNPNISSITPDIFAMNPLNKGFLLSGNMDDLNIKEKTHITPQKADQETVTSKNKISISSNIDSTIWKSTNRNLNPIVLAQKEESSSLHIITNPNSSPKQTSFSTAKHQASILNYIQAQRNENNANDISKNLPSSSIPANKNENNKQNSSVEVSEFPLPQNNVQSCSYKAEDKSSNEIKNTSLGRLNNKVCIAWTRLKRDESLQIMSLTQKLKSKYTKDLDEKVTHLVVSVDDNNRVKDHTMKYILAIAYSIWIVSPTWVRECIQQNQFISEEPYEVLDVSGRQGPKISRLTRLSKPLLYNFVFCFIGPFSSVLKTDLEKVVTNLGAKIVTSPSQLDYQVGKNSLILAEAKETHDFDQFQVWRDILNVLIVDAEWLFRTVGQYQITSVRPYILCLDTDINDLGYPFAMIAPVSETPSQMTMTNTNH